MSQGRHHSRRRQHVGHAHVYGIGGAREMGPGSLDARTRQPRRTVIIGTAGIRPSPPAPYKVMPSFIDTDLNEGLARLETDHCDLYMMHYDEPAAPIGPLMETLNTHPDAGWTHAIG